MFLNILATFCECVICLLFYCHISIDNGFRASLLQHLIVIGFFIVVFMAIWS